MIVVGSNNIRKHKANLEKFARGKHASFFRSRASNEEKSFIKLPLDRKKATKQIPGPTQ